MTTSQCRARRASFLDMPGFYLPAPPAAPPRIGHPTRSG
jgi:hypothetical protein